MAISISSSGKPEIATCEIPSIPRMSFSIFLAYCFNDFNEMLAPLNVKLMVGLILSTFAW